MLRLLLLYILFFCFFASASESPQIYLWRQSYDLKTKDAIFSASKNFYAINFLYANISFDFDKNPRLKIFPISQSYLSDLACSKKASIRIEALNAGKDDYKKVSNQIAEIVSFCVQKIQSKICIDEIQIDFDCPTSKLNQYALWVEKIKASLPENLKLSITAIPSQMKAVGFYNVIKNCDSFTLQVHNISFSNGEYKIFDKESSLEAIKFADLFGKKFFVALPTYSHFVEFDSNSRALKIFSENVLQSGNLKNIKKISSYPLEVAKLKNEIENLNLKNYFGVIFYRLNCGDEFANWSLQTITNVATLSFENLKSDFKIYENFTDGVCELFLENTGNIDLDCLNSFDYFVRGNVSYIESLNGFKVSYENLDGGAILKFTSTNPLFNLSPEQKVKIAWLKFQKNLK